jgi:hypothetical protein
MSRMPVPPTVEGVTLFVLLQPLPFSERFVRVKCGPFDGKWRRQNHRADPGLF